ncbi:MAG: LacI family transcriptional regulator [Ilumatobacteraceae bacterium]|nr:LacI family transcriptional regulator [Ilumatobacteraceae bacterium]
MADVARRADVSVMTVSRVINDHPSVTDETRARVQAAIDALGYRTNMAARTLAGGRSRLLGAISVETTFYGPSHTLFGIEGAARVAGHTVNFVTVREPNVAELRSAIGHLRGAHAEGVIVIAPVHGVVEALREIRPDVPMVITAESPIATSTVSIDQHSGARMAIAHLLGLGHSTVHHVRGPRGWIDADARAEGWRAELRASQRSIPRALTGDWSPRSGYAAGQALAADPNVTAVFVANDQMAVGVLRALHEAGRQVPRDLSVVGFDDIPEAAFLIPPLTTVRQDLDDVGRRSVELLLEMIAGGDGRRMTIEPQLVIRASSAAPRS